MWGQESHDIYEIYEMEHLITFAVWKMREAKNPNESLQSLYGCLYHIRT